MYGANQQHGAWTGGVQLNQHVVQAMQVQLGGGVQPGQGGIVIGGQGPQVIQPGGFNLQFSATQATQFANAAQSTPQKKPPTGDAGITGMCAVTTKALAPVAHMDPEWTLEEMAWKVCGYIGKTAAKFWGGEDDKYTSRCTVAKGQAYIEEFVEACLYAVSAGCAEKPWFNECNLTDILFHATMGTFQNSQTRFMCRTLRPVIQKTVDDAVARFREEERVQKGLWEAVVISGLPEAFQKSAAKHLQNSYDRSHMAAPYGTTTGDTPEIGLVQDFVKGWMEEFCGRAWSVLNEGVSDDKEEQYAFMTTLFQHLTDPEQCCLPFELVSQPGAMPPENWAFVADTAMALLKGDDDDQPKAKKARKGGGKGKW